MSISSSRGPGQGHAQVFQGERPVIGVARVAVLVDAPGEALQPVQFVARGPENVPVAVDGGEVLQLVARVLVAGELEGGLLNDGDVIAGGLVRPREQLPFSVLVVSDEEAMVVERLPFAVRLLYGDHARHIGRLVALDAGHDRRPAPCRWRDRLPRLYIRSEVVDELGFVEAVPVRVLHPELRREHGVEPAFIACGLTLGDLDVERPKLLADCHGGSASHRWTRFPPPLQPPQRRSGRPIRAGQWWPIDEGPRGTSALQHNGVWRSR